MESLYKTHQYLLEHIHVSLRRKLIDDINWKDHLICIKGPRGVGKTCFLLQYAKENFAPDDKRCLYINLNNFYFTVKTIKDFANEFQMKGGKVLLIDQIFKYPNWAEELAFCYDNYPGLQIIFSGSSVLDLNNEDYHLKNKVVTYNLRGFSFREFLELETGGKFDAYPLEEILLHHPEIAAKITAQIKPLAYIDDYLNHGYYPFYLEKRNFLENLLKTMNMMLEVDVMSINQIGQSYLPKIRKLLYLLSLSTPTSPNVSQLSTDIETSRATIMNYIKYLKDARLINMLYPVNEEFPKKPTRLYMHNPNILYATRQTNKDEQIIRETFFYNQLHKDYKVNAGNRNAQFLINGQYSFSVGERIRGKFNPDCYYAISGIEAGERKVIPFWLFGFLY